MDVPKHPALVLMYSTGCIDQAYQQVNQSGSAKVGTRSHLDGNAERDE